MQVTSTHNSSSATAQAADDPSSRLPVKTLNQDDFLKLLIAQMTAQDPLNPQSNTDFAAQMAQFTALEQTRTMASDMSDMRTQQAFAQASSMLGRTVELLQADGQTTTGGVVQSVQVDPNTGGPLLVVNGTTYTLSQVLSIAPTQVK